MGLQAQADRATDEEDLVPEDGGARQPDELAIEVRVRLQQQLTSRMTFRHWLEA